MALERQSDLTPGAEALLTIIASSERDLNRELARHAELVKSRLAWVARRLREMDLLPEIDTCVIVDGSRVLVRRPLLDVTGNYNHDPYYMDPSGKVYYSGVVLWQEGERKREVPVLQEELHNLSYINHVGEFFEMIKFVIAPS